MSRMEIVTLVPDEWQRARAIRVAALTANPEAFGARAEQEAELAEEHWRERVASDMWIVATSGADDVAIMCVAPTVPDTVEPDCPVDPATCAWIYGCWVAPEARGGGIPAEFVGLIDRIAPNHGWADIGLGVFLDNHQAQRVYERMGFEARSVPLESSRRPGVFFQPMFRPVQQLG